MKTSHFLLFLAIFALLFALSCSSDDGDGSSGSNGGNIGAIEPLNKFEAQPASEIGNAKIKYSYSYGGFDFYYIYLGELKNIPLFSYTTQYHDGTKTTYTVSNSETIKESVEQTITNSSQTAISVVDEHTYSTTDKKKISGEIKASGIIGPILAEAKVAGEASWDKYTIDYKNSSFQQTTSLTNTITTGTEYTKTNLISRSWELGKDDKAGYYRYTLFSVSDVYLYVIKDATGAISSYEFKEYVIPDLYFWRFDYSETPSFRKSDATSFEFDISMLDNLPKPEIQLSATNPSSSSNGYQVLSNIDFAGGVLDPWQKSFGSLSAANRGKIELKENSPYGYDAIFTPSGNEVNDWDLQLLQRNLDIKSGYSYKLEFGGNTTKGGTAPIALVLMNCITESDCTEYIKFTAALALTYTDYSPNEWKNCSVTNSNSTFVISGGKSEVEFKIAWVSISATPAICP